MTHHRVLAFAVTVLFSVCAHATELNTVKFSAAMTQIIGSFSTYEYPKVGDTFELDMSKLPKEKIELVRLNNDRQPPVMPYIPLSRPLCVEFTDLDEKHEKVHYIHLVATNGYLKVHIQLRVGTLEKGEKVVIYLYEENYGKIQAMAEAVGVIK